MSMCSSCDGSARRDHRCSRLSTTRTGSAISRPRGAASERSLGLSVLDPALEEVDLCRWPRAIARHRAVTEAREDRIGMSADVVVRPEVEPGLHRLSVTLAEQGFDVGFEAGLTSAVGHPVLLTLNSTQTLRRSSERAHRDLSRVDVAAAAVLRAERRALRVAPQRP